MIPQFASRNIGCADHGQKHPANLVCEASSEAVCGDAHVGRECGCDWFDLDERKYASELNPEGYE